MIHAGPSISPALLTTRRCGALESCNSELAGPKLSSVVFKRFATNILIGELLVQSGILSKERLAEATRQANTKKLQLGQTLVMGGYLSARDLRAAIEAQSLVRDKTIDVQSAVKCLRVVHRTGKSFSDIMSELGVKALRVSPTGKLGELLLDSGLVSAEDLEKAMQRSLTTGLPLGRMLVLQNIIVDGLLHSALEIQVRLRDEMLTRDEAIESLRKAAGKQAPELLSLGGAKPQSFMEAPRRKGIRLGELLVLAGLLTETDVMNALEWGLTNQQPIGQVLVSKNLVSQALLDAALGLQKQVDDNVIDPMQASECLAKIRHSGASVANAVEELVLQTTPIRPSISYQRLLILARVVTDEDVEAAFDISSKSAQVVGRVLSMTGYIDEEILAASLHCHALLASGEISQDDAVAALDYCLHQRRDRPIDFEAALKELGWTAYGSLKMEGEGEVESIESVTAKLAEESAQDEPAANIEPVSPDPAAAALDAKAALAKSAPPVVQAEPSKLAGDGDGQSSQAEPPRIEIPDDGSMDDSAAGVKSKRFSETISPEDPRGKHLARMMSGKGGSDAASGANQALGSAFSRLAESYSEQGNYAEAQLVYERILVKRMNELGGNNIELVDDLNNLAGILCVQGKFNQAEPFMRRAVAIIEKHKPQDALRLADALSMLAEDYSRQEKHCDALPLIERALKLRQDNLGAQHRDVADTLNDYARTLKKLDRKAEADKVYAQAHAILAKRKDFSRLGFASDDDE